MWAEFDPQEYATLGAFRAILEKVWRFYAPRFGMLDEAEPNRAHLALAELERLGLVRAIVTQNIDLLHERAGSRDVVEVHGSIRTSSCLGCGARLPARRGRAADRGARRAAVPACGAVLKPDVVLFDELLPEAAIMRRVELAEEAALLLVVGSSLEVYPRSPTCRARRSWPAARPSSTARRRGWTAARRRLAGERRRGAEAAVAARCGRAARSRSWPTTRAGRTGTPRRRVRSKDALGRQVVEARAHGLDLPSRGSPRSRSIDISVGLRRADPAQVAAVEALGYEYLGENGPAGPAVLRKDEAGPRRTPRPRRRVRGETLARHRRGFASTCGRILDEARALRGPKLRLADATTRRPTAEATGSTAAVPEGPLERAERGWYSGARSLGSTSPGLGSSAPKRRTLRG